MTDLRSDTNPLWLPAGDLLRHYRQHTLSPVEVVRQVLDHAERLQPQLNAFCLLDPETALADARASEQRWQRQAPAGLLDGVPVSIKDIVLTRGWPTLRGSRAIAADQPWTEDAPAVARLREHGAVLFGKTTTSEFAVGAVTHNPLTGITRNPWNSALTPGGSSGGAAAAVASGLGPLALATDAGGSIRIPASFCGVFGFKPSGGRVPSHPPTPYAALASVGPIARTVHDAARMLGVISQPDVRDWHALPHDPVPYHEQLQRDLQGLTLAWSPTLGFAQLDDEVLALCEAAVQAFVEQGARVQTVARVFDNPLPLIDRFRTALTHAAFLNFDDSRLALMGERLVDLVRASRGRNSMTDHLAVEAERARFGAALAAFHKDHALLLTPTVAVPPFAVGRFHPEGYTDSNDWYPFTVPFNFSRQPAASVPCGFTRAGLPVGLQIVGPPHGDLLVLQAARAFEQARPWSAHRPPGAGA